MPLQLLKARSGRMLLQALGVPLLLAGLLAGQAPLLEELYFGPLSTDIGLIVNAAIAALFLASLVRMLFLLLRYLREERALAEFLEQLDFGLSSTGLEPIEDSLVVRRYRLLQQAWNGAGPIEQPALAGLLWQQEQARLGLVRLVHSVLILLGVFGTVASLSLSLVGAAELFTAPQSVDGITVVVRGMATALSTTMTAIAAYLVLAFVFSRLSVSQAHVCQQIETLTLQRLLPMTARLSGDLAADLGRLVGELQAAAQGLAAARGAAAPEPLREELERIRATLRDGFRLERDRS